MDIDNPSGTDDASPLTLSEAAAAYANLGKVEEPAESGHAEAEQEEQGFEAEDTSETEEETGETDDEGQAEDEPEVPEAPQYVADDAKVKLADGTEITVAELKNGTLRLQDYRRKTEELATERKAFADKSQSFQQLEQQMAGDRDFMVQLLQSIMPQKPDPSMFSVDPMGYGEQKAYYDARKEQFDYLIGTMQQADARKQSDETERLNSLRKTEWEATLEKMPELKDGTRLNSFVREISHHGAEYGYTPQEIQQVGLDHRQVLVLRDAIAWRKLQASKSKAAAKAEGRPPVQRGGTRPTPQMQVARDSRAAMDRLTKTGSIKDGVAALLASEKG